MMASGLDLIISQRLIRKLCSNCKAPAKLTESQIAAFRHKNIDPSTIYAPVGCSKCGNIGYKGRIGVFDIMVVDAAMKSKIAESKITLSGSSGADEQMKIHLQKQAMRHVLAGVTSLDEVKKVVSN